MLSLPLSVYSHSRYVYSILEHWYEFISSLTGSIQRYWGTVEDWNVHRDGLQRMIDARGGIGALHGNWRLELVVYLWVKPKIHIFSYNISQWHIVVYL